MKKIITPAVREEYETLCDATGKPAVAGLVMYFWYGSSHDGGIDSKWTCAMKSRRTF